MKQDQVSNNNEHPHFNLDANIQTMKQANMTSDRNSLPSKILYKREPDPNHLANVQKREAKYGIEERLIKKNLLDTPSKIFGNSVFTYNSDETSNTPHQNKDIEFKIKKSSQGGTNIILKAKVNLASFDGGQTSKGISQVVEEQLLNQQNTYTTSILKKSQNIDFDLHRSLKNGSLGKDLNHSNTPFHLKRKSGIEVRNQAQQELEQFSIPYSNYPNQSGSTAAAANQYQQVNSRVYDSTQSSNHTRHRSLDSKTNTRNYQNNNNNTINNNNLMLPSLANANSPIVAYQKSPNNIASTKDSFLNSTLNKSQSQQISMNVFKQRSSFNTQFGNYGADNKLNQANQNNKNQYSPISESTQLKYDPKQQSMSGINNDLILSKNMNLSVPQNGINSSRNSLILKDSYNLNQSILEKSPKQYIQFDDYLCNRRKSSMSGSNAIKISFSNPTTPQSVNDSQSKQNQNSQFFKQSQQQQYGTPKITSHRLSMADSDKRVNPFNQMHSPSNDNKNMSIHVQSISQSGFQPIESSRFRKEEKSTLSNSDENQQSQNSNFNNLKNIISLSNLGNLAESTHLQGTGEMKLEHENSDENKNIQNDIAINELTSPAKSIQPITLTQITTKDYEKIKASCLKGLQEQMFCETFHSSQFENAAKVPAEQQVDIIIQFISLCLEEFYTETLQSQMDSYNHSFLNFKEIDVPQSLVSNSQGTFNQLQWPQFPFKYPERFCMIFLERVTSIIEQNEFVKKKISAVKKLISSNFKKHFCYRDFIKEIGGVSHLPAILTQICNYFNKKGDNPKIMNSLSDVKMFASSILEGDQIGAEEVLNRNIIFPSTLQAPLPQSEESTSKAGDQLESGDQTNQNKKNNSIINQSINQTQSPSSFSNAIQNSPNTSSMTSPQSLLRKKNADGTLTFATSQAKLAQMIGVRPKKVSISSPMNQRFPGRGEWQFSPRQFFDIKLGIFNVLREQQFVSTFSIMQILESIETLRYSTFRCFYGNQIALSYAEHAKNIMNLIPDSHLVSLLGSNSNFNTRKTNFQQFFISFCEHILILNSPTQKLKQYCDSYKINLNTDTIFILENQINYVINAMKVIPPCQRKDIKDKFMRLKRMLKFGETFDCLFDNINEITHELEQIGQKQLHNSKQFNSQEISDIKSNYPFFLYLMQASLNNAGAFSHYDLVYAFQDHTLKEEPLKFWIKSLKRTLQNFSIKSSIINSINAILLDIISSKSLI